MKEFFFLTTSTTASVVIVIFFFFFFTFSSCNGDATASVIYSECSDRKVSSSSPYQYNLNSLLTSLTNSATFTAYANFTASIVSPLYPVSGIYQCRADLSVSDCESCVKQAVSQLPPLCSASESATLQLQGCLLEYGNNSLIGKSDKTLRFKRCGPGMETGGYDPNLLAMRDELLTALTVEPGFYRSSKAGYVDGDAQCVSDQDSKQCNDCIKKAVEELKNDCASAVSGVVYLGKCYAEYAAQGVHHSHSNSQPSQEHDHGERAGKDLAIIIGIVALLILVIFFIGYLRRSSEEDRGKA